MENHIDVLEARLNELNEERDALLRLISIWKGQPTSNIGATLVQPKNNNPSNSIRGRVVDATIELIHKLGRQVSNEEILVLVKDKGLSLGDTKNEQTTIAAILSQEIAKKSARLKRIARGMYDIK
jgi:hypothetical protein